MVGSSIPNPPVQWSSTGEPEAVEVRSSENLAAWRVALTRFFTNKAMLRVPPRFRNEYALPEAITSRLRDLPGSTSVYLHGGVGVGKTQTAWAWYVKCFVEANMRRFDDDSIVFLDGNVQRHPKHEPSVVEPITIHTDIELFDDIRASYGDGGGTYTIPDEHYLIVDDLGKAKPTEWVLEQLFRVLNRRYYQDLPIFVTSELSPGVLADRLGASIASRIGEMCVVLKATGADRRLTPIANTANANKGAVSHSKPLTPPTHPSTPKEDPNAARAV